ncbi:MAG: hypothetical protein VX916_05925 [Planctomycetota bacterium]|nr:hypothetical protein [Planctomycetota bacterium]
MISRGLILSLFLLLAGCGLPEPDGPDPLLFPGEEAYLANVRQLTFSGQNAEAYFSFDDTDLIFQSTRGDLECDQIFIMDLDSNMTRQITEAGRTTCAYFIPGTNQILYASTHEASGDCPPEPDRSQGYVWPVYSEFDIYVADRDGANRRNITKSRGYDAEATISRSGRVVFTSARTGDLELWTMNADGTDLKQLTHSPGYDGGAFFSPDESMICWRASQFDSEQELKDYQRLLLQGLVRPSKMEIYVAKADGSQARRLTDNGSANFGPFFTPDGQFVIFSSNLADPKGRNFDLWMVDIRGENLQQVTFCDSFDGFPMFSWDGKQLAFASNRFNAAPRETNLFIADWVGPGR